jgi:hypothetical protein
MAQRLGLMDEASLPKTVNEAKMLWLGSKMSQIQNDHQNKMIENQQNSDAL